MTPGEVIAIRIRELCKEQNIRYRTLATMSGLPKTTIDNIMNGRSQNPTIFTIMRIASALNMKVSDLLDYPELHDYVYSLDDTPDPDDDSHPVGPAAH